MKDREKYLNIKQLKERGWTQSKIDLWLKKPDKLIKNPVFATASPSKLYLLKRVKLQEKNKRFIDWLEKSKEKRKKLSNIQKKIVCDKRRELIMYINSLVIDVPVINFYKLRKLAFEHYNDYWIGKKYADIKTSDKEFQNRIIVNFLRHECTKYEIELHNIFGKVGKMEGYSILRSRIDEAIYKQYPMLRAKENEDSKNS